MRKKMDLLKIGETEAMISQFTYRKHTGRKIENGPDKT